MVKLALKPNFSNASLKLLVAFSSAASFASFALFTTFVTTLIMINKIIAENVEKKK